jgi:hypothetical protein
VRDPNERAHSKQRRTPPDFRLEDRLMDKMNAILDRWRGPLAMVISLATIVGWFLLLRTDLGYATKRPVERITAVEASVLELKDEVIEIRSQTRPLLVDLCFTASDTVLSLIRGDIDCDTFIQRRGGQRVPPR